MKESDLIQHLLDVISQQHNDAFTIIAIFIAVIGLGAIFTGILQWRFSDKQIDKMKEQFKNEFREEFKIDEMNEILKKTETTQRNAEEKISEMEEVIEDARRQLSDNKKQLTQFKNYDVEGKAGLLAHVSKDIDEVDASNSVGLVIKTLDPIIENGDLTQNTLSELCIQTGNALYVVIKIKFKSEDYSTKMKKLVEMLLNQYTKVVDSNENNSEMLKELKRSTEYMNRAYTEYLNLLKGSKSDTNVDQNA
ncbi:hypothetical protein [Levilactobacillus tujiorum]|uniref:hypothetical protein n=1 Tax=Levilactobacillus tujiorum TaxID=2912243 RepID=UPI001456A22D|nr:hypothetical protein [Levilactobacillus tujiorum]NLR33067.1 hypothetical protein [Levilactobacillus tujiorum]